VSAYSPLDINYAESFTKSYALMWIGSTVL